ncbi:MAG: hypothetical protein U9P90_03440 [Patescibacteria group bacterium]|nr:hypothetical protein [Patescibacteria group bacterium]
MFRFGDVILNILWPCQEHQEYDGEENFSEFLNDGSIVNELVYGEHKFLFTGDITCDTEKEILEFLENFNQDEGLQVLKVPHHGSKFSSCEEFIETVNPDIAVIQVGKNSHGLPSLRIIRRLERYVEKIFRTDEDGDVVFVCDEIECEIKT